MALIRRVAQGDGTLVIAGDALDFQQAWTLTRILRAHQDLLGAMSELAQQGRLIYIVGNHDYDLSLYRDLLHFRVCDALHVGEVGLVTHGHEHDPYIGIHLDGANVATRTHHLLERYLDTWLRQPLGEFYNGPNRLMYWLMHKAGLVAWGANQAFSRMGVERVGQGMLDHLDFWARTNMGDPMCMIEPVLTALDDGPWQWRVCGHAHLPGVVSGRAHSDRHYVNLGSWTFGSSQYATWDGERFELRDWRSGRVYGDELYRPALTGALDEKDFWQWWRENYMGWLRFREGEERLGTLRGWEAYVRDHQLLAAVQDSEELPLLAAPPPESAPEAAEADAVLLPAEVDLLR